MHYFIEEPIDFIFTPVPSMTDRATQILI